jgi:hypothetical protein
MLGSVLCPTVLYEQVKDAQLPLRPNVILEQTGSRTLSHAILDTMFSKATPKPSELFHYATVTALKTASPGNSVAPDAMATGRPCNGHCRSGKESISAGISRKNPCSRVGLPPRRK